MDIIKSICYALNNTINMLVHCNLDEVSGEKKVNLTGH